MERSNFTSRRSGWTFGTVVRRGLYEQTTAENRDDGRQLVEARDVRVALDLGDPSAIHAQKRGAELLLGQTALLAKEANECREMN